MVLARRGRKALGRRRCLGELDINAVVSEHGAFVWRVLRHLGVRESQLDDLGQEVFVVLLERPDAFQGRSSLRTFLYGVCRNVARTARKKKPRETGVEHVPDQAVPATQERSLFIKENRERLIGVLGELSEEQRMIFVLYEIEELSMEEIAQALSAPLRTCYSRLEVARKLVLSRFRRKLLSAQRSPVEVLK
jgi:RNA polymerase sigma-70 factor (ECF subfamily)